MEIQDRVYATIHEFSCSTRCISEKRGNKTVVPKVDHDFLSWRPQSGSGFRTEVGNDTLNPVN